MPDKQTITIDQADDILDSHSYVARQLVSKHRWYDRELVVVFSATGLRGFYHLKPATEIQEGQDEYESDPVEVFPVKAKTIEATVYERA